VILNLAGGIGLFALFWWLTLDIVAGPKWNMGRVGNNIRAWAIASLSVLIITIVLGAWTDAYYAALACTSFPDCHGQWWPGMKLAEGLALLGTLDVDVHGKVIIDGGVAAAIHMAHRLGALLAFVVIATLGIRAWGMGGRCRMAGAAVLLLLMIQVVLGVAAVIADLPMVVVASHSSLSAVMIISILTLAHRGWSGQRQGGI
ncbi:MAG: COX15/CtaA family protein, partial [Mariprofundaceae bacterium]